MAFMANEAKKLELFVKLGEFEKIEKLAYQAHIVYKYQKKYNIRVSLSELKSLSQLQLKIIYDSQEYGQQKPQGRQDAVSHSSWEETGANWFGITIKEDKPSPILSMLIKADSSFIITQLRAGSLADTAGLKEGDVINEINGKYLSSLRQYRDGILLGIQQKKIKFTVRRGIRYLPIVIGTVQQNETSTGGYKKPRKAKILY